MEISAQRNKSTLRAMLRPASWPFIGVQIAAVIGVIAMGWSWTGLLLAVVLYYVRMFFLTAGYHRYFAHRSYHTSRAFQFLLALFGSLCVQKGALWWAARHRHHHKFSDQPNDLHSPVQDGFWWAHMGWFMGDDFTDDDRHRIPDFARYPELVWLDRWMLVPPVAFAVILFLAGGWHALLWGFFVSTTLLWHGTFTINSLSHVFGSRRYATRDTSRNNPVLALITMGEGWHNNHHHYQSSANQGFFWWEVDLSFLVLKLLSKLGVVWDLRRPPAAVLEPSSSVARAPAVA